MQCSASYCTFLIPNIQNQEPVQLLHAGRRVFQFIQCFNKTKTTKQTKPQPNNNNNKPTHAHTHTQLQQLISQKTEKANLILADLKFQELVHLCSQEKQPTAFSKLRAFLHTSQSTLGYNIVQFKLYTGSGLLQRYLALATAKRRVSDCSINTR